MFETEPARQNAGSALANNVSLQKHLRKTLPIIIDAALQAGHFIGRKFKKIQNLQIKADTSLVTEADKGAEEIVVKILKKHFPYDHIVAEESGSTAGKDESPFCWHIDPLDGTTNFVHGFPFFCVSIGLQFEKKDPILGVIYHPITKDLYFGSAGNGAFHNKHRMEVSKTDVLNKALLTTGFNYRKSENLVHEMNNLNKILGQSRGIRRTGSAALDLAFTAAGQFDGFWERGLASWDIAAGLTLLIEAGGSFSQFDGSPYHLGDKTFLATNSKLHETLVNLFDAKSIPRNN